MSSHVHMLLSYYKYENIFTVVYVYSLDHVKESQYILIAAAVM